MIISSCSYNGADELLNDRHNYNLLSELVSSQVWRQKKIIHQSEQEPVYDTHCSVLNWCVVRKEAEGFI